MTVLFRLIPAADRDAIVGDLLEEAGFRGLRGAARTAWLARECAGIALGLSVQRVRGWLVVPPVRELAAGFVVDGRGVLRDVAAGTVLKVLAFVASVATLALGVEVLVRTLMTASGY